MSLGNPIKLYQNPCKTVGSGGACRECSNGIGLGGAILRGADGPPGNLFHSVLSHWRRGRAPPHKPWTVIPRKMLSG